MRGRIDMQSNGSCLVSNGNILIKLEKHEIKNVVLKDGCRRPCPHKYDSLIHKASLKYQIDSALIKAVIQVESNFEKDRISSKGACGLMQLMPETAEKLGVKNIFSPEENIFAGTRYLKEMLDVFEGDLVRALAAYNAGPNIVKKYNDVPPYTETQEYVRNVCEYFCFYYNSD